MSTVETKWIRNAADEHAVRLGCWFDERAAVRVEEFFRKFLRHSKGQVAGKPFELLKWQREELIYPLFGWKRRDGSRRFRKAYVQIPKKNGKALEVNTPIPTPEGWKKIGEIKTGDRVFDECGNICNVVATSGVMFDRLCAEIEFSDGCKIVADVNHEWTVGVHSTAKTETLTTWEMMPHVKCGAASNYRIPVAGSLKCDEAELPVDPYILGAWLGDGHSASARLTCGNDDLSDMLPILLATGVNVRETKSGNDGSALLLLGSGGRCQYARNDSLQAKLRAVGVLNNKHIPAAYLRASVGQRTSLLQGLMDTDGYVSKAGQCEFTTTSEAIRDGVIELLRSLGFKPSLKTARATISGRDCGEKYRIQFWAFKDSPVFRLKRKAERQIDRPSRVQRSTNRHIVAIRPVESVPVCCIQVDSPNRLYLCGESMIPTHNSTLAAGIGLYLLVGDGEAGAEVYSAACTRDQAGIVHNEAISMTNASDGLSSILQVNKATKEIKFHRTNSTYKALASEAHSSEGLNAHGLIIDELHAWQGQAGRNFFDALKYAGRARRQPLQFIITTAGDDELSVCYETYQYAKDVLAGRTEDQRFFAYIAEADPSDDWTQPEIWSKANPSLGDTISIDEFEADLREAQKTPTSLAQFLRYSFNLWARTGGVAPITDEAWQSCRLVFTEEDVIGWECWAAIDLARVNDMTAVAFVFRSPENPEDYRLLVYYWLPESTVEAKWAPEQYRVWAKQGLIRVTPGNVTDYSVVERELIDLINKFQPMTLAFDPYLAEELTQRLYESTGVERVAFAQTASNYAAPSAEFERRILAKKLLHNGDPITAWQVGNLRWKLDANGNRRPIKPQDGKKIDGIVAAIMATSQEMATPAYSGGGVSWLGGN